MAEAPKPPPLPRPGTHGEIRRRTPPQGWPTEPRQDDEDVTGNIDLTEFQIQEARKARLPDAAIAHHDERLDKHAATLKAHDNRIRVLEIGLPRVEGVVGIVNTKMDAHTAILGSQTAQLDRLLDEKSADTINRRERGTATYKHVLAWITPVVSAVVTYLVARGC